MEPQSATKVLNNTWLAYGAHRILIFHANNINLFVCLLRYSTVATTVRDTGNKSYKTRRLCCLSSVLWLFLFRDCIMRVMQL